MNQQETDNAWPVLEVNDPPLELTRENAAYQRDRERLLSEHAGKIALIYGPFHKFCNVAIDINRVSGNKRW